MTAMTRETVRQALIDTQARWYEDGHDYFLRDRTPTIDEDIAFGAGRLRAYRDLAANLGFSETETGRIGDAAIDASLRALRLRSGRRS